MLPLLFLAALLWYTGCGMAALHCRNCGRTPVPYPLSTRPGCGDQAYKVRCTGGTLWLDALNGSSYTITPINPETQRIIIQPASIATNTYLTTDFHSQGIQLDSNLPFNITSRNTILLMNCTDAILQLRVPINCSSSCICHSYIANTIAAEVCMHESTCCMFRTGGFQTAYMILVHSRWCSAYQSFINLNPSLPVAKWPEPGVEIEWVLPQQPICKLPADCHDLGTQSVCPIQRVPDREGASVIPVGIGILATLCSACSYQSRGS